jgi:uncharacterized membrane protein YoaK (UPF0700 family)
MDKPTGDPALPFVLLGMTAVTGLVDAVSYLALGHVFTANMTGNIVLLGFASASLPGVSIWRSLAALGAFLLGATAGGRFVARTTPETLPRVALRAFTLELALLIAAALSAIGYDLTDPVPAQLYALIACTGIAMGLRTAVVRKLAVPDLTTTVLTLTIVGIAADSSLAHGTNPRWLRRVAAVAAMFSGAALGALLVRHSVFTALVVCASVSAVCSGALLLRRSRRQ